MSPDQVQVQARALGHPTRHRIFRHIVEAGEGLGISELTALLGLNHNAIRQHIAKLEKAGLVVRTLAPARGPGRPRQLYEPHPDADERWGAGGPYQRLSLMLVEMLRTGAGPVEVGRRAGRQSGPATDDSASAVDRLGDALTRGGFEPELVAAHDLTEFVLHRCPFVAAAEADPDTVCSLHLGLAQGLAEQQEGVVVEALERRDPRHAGCRLRFRLQAG